MHRGARFMVAAAGTMVAMVGGVACSGDDDGAASPADGPAGAAEFCTAFVAADQGIETLPWDDPDALAGAYATDVEPLFDTANGTAPDAIADSVATLTGAVHTAITTGDFSGFDDPVVATAQGDVFGQLSAMCDLPLVEVTATDFAFDGLADTVAAGPAVIVFHNEGDELHEIGIARVGDDVDLSAEEIFALPPDEAFELLEFRSGTSTPPGSTGGTTIDLEPGRYVAFCMIPIGSTEGHGDGAPHVTAGMYDEFTVA